MRFLLMEMIDRFPSANEFKVIINAKLTAFHAFYVLFMKVVLCQYQKCEFSSSLFTASSLGHV